ncbi:MAG: hypothetical protein FWG63_05410, partial [Defluviitaleaceae bacterium]|nr:hypothetical protein [Defluviitaleaceae bacterium]
GTTARPKKEIIQLSSAFETPIDKDFGELKLEIPVYNINKGMNKELFKKSPKLRQYAEFIAKVRELNKLYDDYARAVREAANYCIANDILSDFLREQGGRIVSILSTEFDLDVAKKVWREENREEKAFEIARNLLRMNLSLEQIIAATGLTHEEVESLRTTI